VFTKTASNTFGLIEFGTAHPDADGNEIPEEFGSMEKGA
jgi:hypothetical protein